MYDMQSESQLSYEQILAKKDPQETQAADASEENKDISVDQTGSGNTQTGENGNPSVEAASASTSAGENLVSLEKLNDFDYLIQHYYTVDNPLPSTVHSWWCKIC